MIHRYVVTAYQFNHVERPQLIDRRLLDDPGATFYCVDPERVDLGPRPPLYECDLDPRLTPLGRDHLAEWTFFIAEHRHAFASYPFFVISSRFYEKNTRLPGALADYDAMIADAIDRFGYAYLPSYERDSLFEDLREYFALGRLGMTQGGLDYACELFGVQLVSTYRYMSDFFCNYIGFRDRPAFEAYYASMAEVLDDFIGSDLTLRRSYDAIVRRRNVFRKEKPLTLFLEMCSHMHFYCNEIPFAGLKYDGLYAVHERNARAERLLAF